MANDTDLVHIGDSRVDEQTSLPVAQCVNPAGDDQDDVEHFAEVDMFGALGVTALPAPKDDDGVVEGVVLRSCGGTDAICVAARDERSADVVGQLAPGETALHSTGKDFGARVFCKDQHISLVISQPPGGSGGDYIFMLDRITGQATLSAAGHIIEASEQNGIALCAKDGKASIQVLEGGTIWLKADKVLLGPNPTAAAIKVDPSGAPMPVGPATSVLLGP